MRGEVLVGPERRGRWSEDEEARIIEESLRRGAQVADIARRHGVSRGLLYRPSPGATGRAVVGGAL